MSGRHSAVRLSHEVEAALADGRPVVALESTITSSFGLPAPHNRDCFERVDRAIRAVGAVPAVTGVLDGRMIAGVEEEEVERILAGDWKLAERDLPIALARRASIGVSTVSATVAIAHLAGIRTFATGGIVEAAKAGITPTDSKNSAYIVMAACMAAGMTPPLGLALATVLRKNLFSDAEIENGKAAWVLGASFITEGAIPFAVVDPLRVIPSLMAGSAVTGAMVMAFGNTLRAPHGGIWVISLIGSPLTYLIAIAVGTAITAAAVVALKASGSKASA